MKVAVALINVPDDADINELCITFDLERMLSQDGDVETIWGCISEPLRRLPEMIDADTETDMSGGDDYASGYRDGWKRGIEIGWNRYRKAITGETG